MSIQINKQLSQASTRLSQMRAPQNGYIQSPSMPFILANLKVDWLSLMSTLTAQLYSTTVR